jgi:hypothetical protein
MSGNSDFLWLKCLYKIAAMFSRRLSRYDGLETKQKSLYYVFVWDYIC